MGAGISKAASRLARLMTSTSPPSSAPRPESAISPLMVMAPIPWRRPARSSSSPTPRPYRSAQACGARTPSVSVALSGSPATTFGRRMAASVSTSMPRTSRVKTRSLSPGAVETVSRRSATGATARTSGNARTACSARGEKPASSKARIRTSALPRRSTVAPRSACSDEAPVMMVAVTTATPSAIPMMASAVRRGRARSPRQAMLARRIGARDRARRDAG